MREATLAKLKAQSGELVEIEVEQIDGVDTLRQIVKFPMHEDGRGKIYLASYTFPFENFGLAIKLQCPELGITGIRESAIMSELIAEDKLDLSKLDESGKMPQDVIDLISQTTDEERYDKAFPNHPLTHMRIYLQQIRSTVKFDEIIHQAKPFRM